MDPGARWAPLQLRSRCVALLRLLSSACQIVLGRETTRIRRGVAALPGEAKWDAKASTKYCLHGALFHPAVGSGSLCRLG